MVVSRLLSRPCGLRCGWTKRGQDEEVLGRSRGGFGTKIQVAVDGLGNPVDFQRSAGQEADITHAPALIAGYEPEAGVADNVSAGNAFVETIETLGAKAFMPPKSNRAEARNVDWHREATESGRAIDKTT